MREDRVVGDGTIGEPTLTNAARAHRARGARSSGDFQAVVRLIIGGIAERRRLRLRGDRRPPARGRAPARRGRARRHRPALVRGRRGRHPHARSARCASTRSPRRSRDGEPRPGELTLRRILETVVDSFGVEDADDGAIVVRLEKRKGRREHAERRARPHAEAPRGRTASCCAATTRAATRRAREELIAAPPAAGALAGAPLRRPRRGARGHRAGRRDRPDQGDRPLRARARGVARPPTRRPNVVGEIKRHFRDKGWAIRVPRALQELNASMSGAIERLTGRLGRSPSIAEIAEELKTTPEEVLEAMEVGSAYSTVSLSTGPGGRGRARPARDDRRRGRGVRALRAPRRARAGARAAARSASARSCACASRRACRRRRSPQRVGLSQMHVSRLIRKSLSIMREELLRTPPGAA